MSKKFLIAIVYVIILSVVETLAFASDVAINSTNFPDENFRAYLNTFDTEGH